MSRLVALLLIPGLISPVAALADRNELGTELKPRPGLQAILEILRRRAQLPPAEREKRRGDFWLQVRRCDKALQHYRQALELDSRHVEARFRLAFCLHQTKKTDEAIAALGKVLELDPKFVPAYVGLGDLHAKRKQWDQAEAILAKGLEVAANDPRVLLALGRVLRLHAEEGGEGADARKQKAIEHLTRAEKLAAPKSSVALEAARQLLLARHGKAGEQLLHAREAIARGEPQRALALLDEVVARQPSLTEAHYLRGVALASPKIDKVAEAIAAYKQAGGSREALLAIGRLHYERGEMEEAEEWMKKAVAADPKFQEAHYELGLVYKELGEYDKALAAWKRAVEAGPRSKIGRWAATKVQVLTGKVLGLAEGEVLDPAAERYLGQKFMEIAIQRWGLVNDEALQTRLEGIARKLVAVSDRGAESLRYEIRIVNNRAVNAVTFPGGKILVFQGMVDLVRKDCGDEDAVWAAVLGHEIAHAALRHGVTKAKILSARASLAEGSSFGAILSLNSFLSGFSRANEFEADQYGALYAYRSGFNPAGGLRLHRAMMQRREIPAGLGHPPHAERIARLREYLLELRAKTRAFHLALKALGKHDYGRAVQLFEVFLGVFPNSVVARNNLGLAMHKKAMLRIPAGAYKKSSDVDPNLRVPPITLRSAATVARKMQAVRGAQVVLDRPLLREAVAELQLALRTAPSYVPALVNLGAALLDLGARKEAVEALQQALRLDPENRHAQNNLAVAHLEAGQRDEGLTLLQKLTATYGDFGDAFYNLAVAHDRDGNRRPALEAYEKYLSLDPDSGWAKVARERVEALKKK